MTHRRRHAAEVLILPAGRTELCLDFANSLCWRGSATPQEALAGLPELLRWATEHAGIPDAVTAEAAPWPQAHPGRAGRLFTEAIALRETIFRLFSAVAAGAAVAADDLATLNAALEQAPPRRHLAPLADEFAWLATPAPPSAALLLAPVLWSAADLLAHGTQHRIRCCANAKCLWLFVDHSKTGTRRWCDMAACGNRAKSQRHYARSKAE